MQFQRILKNVYACSLCPTAHFIPYTRVIIAFFMGTWTISLFLTGTTRAVLTHLQRLKKEPRVSNRDITGLMNGGAYMSEGRS